MRSVAVVLVICVSTLLGRVAAGAPAGNDVANDLDRARELAWSKDFASSEALYLQILEREPASRPAQVGLAQVILWQGRYDEAITRFRAIEPQDAETIEGIGLAAYWSGDLRTAARMFERVLAVDANREQSRQSLAEIRALARPEQRITVRFNEDDQPLERARVEAEAVLFSDPLTRWSVLAGGYAMDAGRIGKSDGPYVSVGNETTWRDVTIRAGAGLFTYPDGTRRPVGHLGVRRGSLELHVEQQEALASATSLRTHPSALTTTLRWSRERAWIAAVEVNHRQWFDDNETFAAIAYGVAPLLARGSWKVWGGASFAARDSSESRFTIAAVSSTREGEVFRYTWRGEYDPYWAPRDQYEARAVAAVEFRVERGGVKIHADAGVAQDRARAFGPDSGATPLPAFNFAVDFDRSYNPYRFGVTFDRELAPGYWIEAAAERSVTVDYRSTSLHVSLVRRR